ncbi:MAG: hypothetical protein ACK2T3_07510 [Candidatus Promineifilaceae bacterium]
MSAETVRQRPRPKRAGSKKAKRRKLLWLTEAQAALGWAVLLLMGAVLGAIYLHQTSGIAEVGRTVQRLQYEVDEIKRINSQLELDIADAQSLDRLLHQAEQDDFIVATPADLEVVVVRNVPPSKGANGSKGAQSESNDIETALEAVVRALTSRIGGLSRGEAQ